MGDATSSSAVTLPGVVRRHRCQRCPPQRAATRVLASHPSVDPAVLQSLLHPYGCPSRQGELAAVVRIRSRIIDRVLRSKTDISRSGSVSVRALARALTENPRDLLTKEVGPSPIPLYEGDINDGQCPVLDIVPGREFNSMAADIRNSGERPAGTITAGHFFGHFAGSMPWAHLDNAEEWRR